MDVAVVAAGAAVVVVAPDPDPAAAEPVTSNDGDWVSRPPLAPKRSTLYLPAPKAATVESTLKVYLPSEVFTLLAIRRWSHAVGFGTSISRLNVEGSVETYWDHVRLVDLG